jgi:RNA polymerase sigma-70 factor (ECF subfamily)
MTVPQNDEGFDRWLSLRSKSQGIRDQLRLANDELQTATNALLEQYRPRIRQMVDRYRLKSSELKSVDQSDLVQDVSLRVWAKATSFRGGSREEFDGWLRKITRNVVLDAIRKAKAAARGQEQPLPASQLIEPGESALSRLSTQEQKARFWKCLEAFPLHERGTLVLRLVNNLPHAEIALVLGRSVDSVEKIFSRAKYRLIAMLAE